MRMDTMDSSMGNCRGLRTPMGTSWRERETEQNSMMEICKNLPLHLDCNVLPQSPISTLYKAFRTSFAILNHRDSRLSQFCCTIDCHNSDETPASPCSLGLSQPNQSVVSHFLGFKALKIPTRSSASFGL